MGKQYNFVLRVGDTISLPVLKRSFVVGVIMCVCLFASIIIGMKWGSVHVTWHDVWWVLTGNINANDATETIWQLRIPRLIASIIAGMLMALSGYMLQIIAQNALADPGVLGLSTGAVLFAILIIFFVPDMPAVYVTGVTFFGAIITGTIVYAVANGHIQGAFVVLVGIAVSAVISAIIDIIFSVMSFENMVATMAMIAGDFSYVNMGNAVFLIFWFLLCGGVFLGYSRLINPMSLGALQAGFLGIKVKPTLVVLLLLSIAAMAPVIAIVGAIGFIGLVATFLTKNLIGYRGTELGVISMLVGAIMTVWADTLGRTLFAPIMVHAGVFISLIGGLFFVVFIYIGKKYR